MQADRLHGDPLVQQVHFKIVAQRVVQFDAVLMGMEEFQRLFI